MSKNKIKLDLKGLDEMLTSIDKAGGNIEKAVEVALKAASDKVASDTEKALDKPNLPAKGKYSHGGVINALIRDDQVQWGGTVASIGAGFDFAKDADNALTSIFLIFGTPKMKPDAALRKIYVGRAYKKALNEEMKNILSESFKG